MQLDLRELRVALGPLPPHAGPPEGPAFFYLQQGGGGGGAPTYAGALGGGGAPPPAGAHDGGRALSEVHRYALLSRMPRTANGEIDPRALATLAAELSRSHGLHDSVLALLPLHAWVEREELVAEARACSICMAPYSVGESCRTLPCLHFFHAGCCDAWLKQSRTCPVCRCDCSRVLLSGAATAQ